MLPRALCKVQLTAVVSSIAAIIVIDRKCKQLLKMAEMTYVLNICISCGLNEKKQRKENGDDTCVSAPIKLKGSKMYLSSM